MSDFNGLLARYTSALLASTREQTKESYDDLLIAQNELEDYGLKLEQQQRWIPMSPQEIINKLAVEFGVNSYQWDEIIPINLSESAGLDIIKALGLPQTPTAEEE